MYSIMLAEDDIMQREIIKKIILFKNNKSIKIYEADSESVAIEIIKNNYINMFLIDIILKDSSGLDLAMKVRNIPKYEFSQLIFLTTHVDYILQAFKQTHCYDYILKPYDIEKVQVMLNKLINKDICYLNKEKNYLDKVEDKELVIKVRNGIFVRVKINNILFIEVNGRDCEVNTSDGIYTYNNISLKKMLQLTNCEDIVQSHKAFAVNKKYIFKIEKLDFRLSSIYFKDYSKTALLGYKFKNDIMSCFKEVSKCYAE